MRVTTPHPAPSDHPAAAPLNALRAAIPGGVHLPGKDGYAAAITGFSITDRPAPELAVTPANAAEVAAAVTFAREQRLGIGVMATGHNVGHPHRGGLFINTARMRGVTVDPVARTVRAEAGTTWGEVLAVTQAHGLAPLSGSAPGVGVVGYTVYGGFGWLARQFGSAAGSIRAAEIVTADGMVRRVDAEHEPDLLWALGGGGGNFGIVTALVLVLYPVATIYGGALFFPLERAEAVLEAYAAWVETVPDAVTSALVFGHLPPLATLPEPLRGRAVISIRACSVAPGEDGSALLAPFRALPDPLLNTFRTMPYADAGEIAADPAGPVAVQRATLQLAELGQAARATLLDLVGPASASPLIALEIRHLGGALARATDESCAFGRRAAPFFVQTVGFSHDPALAAATARYTATVVAALAPHATDTIMPGWLGDGDFGPARTRAGYSPANYARLAALKARYDPDNLFRLMHNIPGER